MDVRGEVAVNQRLEHELLRTIFEVSPLAITVVDRDGCVIAANGRAEKMLGLTRDRLTDRMYNDPGWVITDFDGHEFPEENLPFQRVRRTLARVEDVRHAIELGDGTRVFLNINAMPMLTPDGAFDGMVAVIEDVTPAVRIDKAFSESEAMLRSIFRAAPVGIGVVKNRVLMWTNQRIHEMTGYSAEELQGQNSRILYPSDEDFDFVGREKYQQISQHGTGTVETRWLRRDGREIDVILSSTPIDLADLEKGVTFSALDITERKQLEDRLRHSQKMEAVGQLAGGIAHDFNNQLSGIMGFADLLRSRVGHDPILIRYTINILNGVQRATDLTANLLAFARKGKYLAVPVDVHRIVVEVASLLRHTIGKNIRIRQVLNANPSTTKGDPSQLQSAILNLAINARDAMPDGGELSIATDVVAVDETWSEPLVFGVSPGAYVRIDIRDTGVGIPPNILDRIFEPFFTTKEAPKGTGLGLAAVYGTVQNHGGGVGVTSSVGGGTTFTLLLPVHAGEDERPQAAASVDVDPLPGDDGATHVLVVDDEPGVGQMVAEMLEIIGCRATVCLDGKEAVETYRRSGGEIDAVLLDLVMPNLDGEAVFRALKKIDPQVRVLVSSGYSVDGGAQKLLAEGASGFIQKPYKIADLRASLAKILA
jgi:two-component system cell cycle sensor histidine kinase/response regulator CckA